MCVNDDREGYTPHCHCYGLFAVRNTIAAKVPKKSAAQRRSFSPVVELRGGGWSAKISCPKFSRERSDSVYRYLRGSERQSPGVKGFFNGLEKYMDSRYR